LIDGGTGCLLVNCQESGRSASLAAIDCPTADDCKIAYYAGHSDLIFADCDDATCSTGTLNILNGAAGCVLTGCISFDNYGNYPSISCPAADDCKIAYYAPQHSALYFADCDDAT